MPAVDRLDVHGAADSLTGRRGDALVTDAERRCEVGIAAAGVGNRRGVGGDDRFQQLLQVAGFQRRQFMTLMVCRSENASQPCWTQRDQVVSTTTVPMTAPRELRSGALLLIAPQSCPRLAEFEQPPDRPFARARKADRRLIALSASAAALTATEFSEHSVAHWLLSSGAPYCEMTASIRLRSLAASCRSEQ